MLLIGMGGVALEIGSIIRICENWASRLMLCIFGVVIRSNRRIFMHQFGILMLFSTC